MKTTNSKFAEKLHYDTEIQSILFLTRVSVRSDKRTVYAGDEVVTEIYMLNDRPKKAKVRIIASVYLGDELFAIYKT